MIRAARLTKRFGAHLILDRLELAVAQGERVALLGLNGAGKTTLMRCLLGLIPFDGSLSIAGRDVRADGRAARAHLGYVPQRAPHFDGSVAEMIEFFTELRGIEPAVVESRLESFGLALAEHQAKPVRALSGGMLQKVLLALALGADVPLLLLDEPTANLDPRARREFLRTVQSVARDTTILLASHRFSDVQAIADRLLVLHDGRIVFDDTVAALRDRVGDAVTLWVKVPAELRERARQHLASLALPAVFSNGSAIGVRVDQAARADVLVELRHRTIPVEDFWTEVPSLQALLETVLGVGRQS